MESESFSFSIGDTGPLPDRSNEIIIDPGLGLIRQAEGSYRIFHEWISVKDKLPGHFQHVIGFAQTQLSKDFQVIPLLYEYREVFCGEKESWAYLTAGNEGYAYAEKVSHWMPLPKPPKEDD